MINRGMIVGLDLGLFVDVCRVFFGQMGFESKETESGAAPGLSRVNILFNKQTNDPLSIFQCYVGADSPDFEVVSRFHDVMAVVKMTNGYFLSTGPFSPDLQSYGMANRINLVDLDKLVDLINRLPESSQDLIREIASQGGNSFNTKKEHVSEAPECAKCGFHMQFRVSEGKYKEGRYWECPNPDCKYIVALTREP